MWTHQQTIYWKLIEQDQCALFLISPIKKSIKLGKQIVMILQINHMCMVLSGNIGFEMGHDDKNETKF